MTISEFEESNHDDQSVGGTGRDLDRDPHAGLVLKQAETNK